MRRSIAYLILLFAIGRLAPAQDKYSDSIVRLIRNAKTDSLKYGYYLNLADHFEKNYKFDEQKSVTDSLVSIAYRTHSWHMEGKAYKYYASYFTSISNYNKALPYYLKSQRVFEQHRYYYGICSIYLNMGNLYFYTQNYSKSYELYKKSLATYKSHGLNDEETLANIYNNLGSCAATLEDYKLAREYFYGALNSFIKQGDNISIAYSYNNLGLICTDLEERDSAKIYLNKALELKKLYGSKSDILDGYRELGSFFYKYKDVKNALQYYLLAESLIDTAHVADDDVSVYYSIYLCYKTMKDINKAIYYLELCYQYKLEINKVNQKSNLEQAEGAYNVAKKHYRDSLLNISNTQLQQIKIEQQNRQLEIEKQQRVFLLIGLVIVLMGGVLFYNRYKITQKQKGIIEIQKNEVEEKNAQILVQHQMIEEKQKEIIDSINYAQRIQQAVLTNEKVWEKVSHEHFVVFKPKDIVSGDFYWAYNTPNNRSIWVAADCTGHGVPGAFMSMLGNSFLNQIVIENKIFSASEILNKLRSKIIEALEKEGVKQNDGMDLSLCVWNKLNNVLEIAGANNSVQIVRDEQLIEFKGNKMPIGNYHGELIPFTSQEFQLKKEDVIYMYTDGFADQFGGAKGKKFRYKALDELLISNAQRPMKEQAAVLNQTFLTWKGGLIQTDDVCIIGIKVLT